MKVYLPDIPESEAGTWKAYKKVLFYVKLDVDNPAFIDGNGNNVLNSNTNYQIKNKATLTNNYTPKMTAAPESE